MIIFPASGTGAWEAALVNTLVARRPGADGRDRPLRHAVEKHGDHAWACSPNSSRATGAMAPIRDAIEARLARGQSHAIKAVCVVHNETSTGVASRDRRQCAKRSTAPRIRRCFMVDTISSLASIDYRHDEWGVDVTVGGLAERPHAAAGLVLQRRQRQGARRVEQSRSCRAPTGRGRRCSAANKTGFFPYTPATNLLYGLREALRMLLEEEGLDNVFARHDRARARPRAARCAPGAWRSCA